MAGRLEAASRTTTGDEVDAVSARLADPAGRRRAVARLAALVRIPSVSGDPKHASDLDRAAAHLASLMGAIGLERVEVIVGPSGAAANVYGEWCRAPGRPTILLYGHYDVQPPGPGTTWRHPPFGAVVADGYLHGRGASDDKGQLLTHLAAIEAWLGVCGRLPVNVKVWLEGEEEIGSPNVGSFLDRERGRLRCDAVLVSDTQMLGPTRPAIVYGLRGLAGVEVEVRGPSRELHDGLFGGVAANPIHELARVVAALHDERGRIAIPGFYAPVRSVGAAERAELRRAMPSDEALAVLAGTVAGGEPGWRAAERTTVRPALNVTAIAGGQTRGRARSVVPASARARINVRLVPDQDPRVVAQALTSHLRALVQSPHRVGVRIAALAHPVVLPRDRSVVDAAVRAVRAAFGVEPVFVRSGGTIPAVAAIHRQFGVPVVLLGFGLPDDSIHAPNERFLLANLHRGTAAVARFLAECSK